MEQGFGQDVPHVLQPLLVQDGHVETQPGRPHDTTTRQRGSKTVSVTLG